MGRVGYVCVLVAVVRVGWCYVCVCCESGFSVLIVEVQVSVYYARWIPVHLRCIQRVRMAGLPKNGNRAPIAGGGRVDTIRTGFSRPL